MKILELWDELNKKIVACVLNFITTGEVVDSKQIAKIQYALTYLLNEISKFLFLSIVFMALNSLSVFFISFCTLTMLRIFMGGTHRKTTLGCFLQSSLTFAAICCCGRNVQIYNLRFCIYIITVGLIWCSTPIISEKRVRYSQIQRMTFKARVITVLLVLSVLIEQIPVNLGNYMIWAIVFQSAEVALITITNFMKGGEGSERTVKEEGKSCFRKSSV